MSLAKAIGPEIEEMIREGSPDLAKAVADLHPADLAELLEDLPREDRLVLFEALPPEQGAAVLSELKGETLRLVLHQASPEKLGPELDRLPGDEVVFLLEHVSQRQREVLLAKMSPRDAAEAPATAALRAGDRRPSHDREVREGPPGVDGRGDPRAPEEDRPGGRDHPDDLRGRRRGPPGRRRFAAPASAPAAGPEDRRAPDPPRPDGPAPTRRRRRSRSWSRSTTST